jgi:uncharacterized membrane protein (UPF0127 family)
MIHIKSDAQLTFLGVGIGRRDGASGRPQAGARPVPRALAALSGGLRATRRAMKRAANRAAPLAALIAALAWLPAAQAQDAPQKLGTVRLNAGMHLITAEVAQTPDQRQIGLMHRPSMPTNDGMLFVFEAPGMNCFWMRNTLLPLSIAFVADDGTIVNIEDMQPQTDASHCPKKPVRYALEMNQGWFAKRGVQAGQKLGGGPFAAK